MSVLMSFQSKSILQINSLNNSQKKFFFGFFVFLFFCFFVFLFFWFFWFFWFFLFSRDSQFMATMSAPAWP